MESSANLKALIHFMAFFEKVEKSFSLHTLVKNDRGLHHIPPECGLAPPFVHRLPVWPLTACHLPFFPISKTSFVEANQLNGLEIRGDIYVIWANISVGITPFSHVFDSI
jgi:hypothetical protein